MSREEERGLVIRDLAVSLQKQEILHRISLKAEEGEFLSLLGIRLRKEYAFKMHCRAAGCRFRRHSSERRKSFEKAAGKAGSCYCIPGFETFSPYDSGAEYYISHGNQKNS